MSGDDAFLERWSRRKTEERKATIAQGEIEPPPDASLPDDASAGADGSIVPADSAPITEAELAALPPVEALTAQSDLRAFLRPGVPAALKNAAMRKMWLLTPAIRDHKDCAVDYAWDWNTPGGVPGNGGTMSAESVAKMLKDLTGPSPEPADQRAISPDDPAAPPVLETGHKDKAPSPDTTVQRPEPDAPEDNPTPRTDTTASETRRHGGAMPS